MPILFSINRISRHVRIVSWALYDLANQFFAVNIVSLYFVRWLTIEKKVPEIWYSLAFGVSMFFVAILAPFLGAFSDAKGRHKTFLVYFTVLSALCTVLMGFTNKVWVGLILFVIANFGCQEAVVFYNSLMLQVSSKETIGYVSGVGRMFGYIGAVIALLFTKPVVLERGYSSVFIMTGVLFLLFALPCMIFVKEISLQNNPLYFTKEEGLRKVFKEFKEQFKFWKENYRLVNFLKASLLIFGVVNVIILFMSVYASKVFGLKEADIINLIIFSTFFAILGSIVSGILSDYFGYGKVFLSAFVFWVIALMSGTLIAHPFWYWAIGAVSGLSLGITWVASRAFMAKVVPKEKIGGAFGIFNLIGYLSGIIGPLWWGVVVFCLKGWGELGYRIALFSLVPFLVIGSVFLLRTFYIERP